MFINKINIFLPQYENIEKNYFLEILNFSNKKNFDLIKLEKDFLLTLILIKFGKLFPDLIFKWGTCLNKIYFPYFRLSEDLDFVINHDWGRASRRTLVKKIEKSFIEELELLWITLESKKKVDKYRIAMWTFNYDSVVNGRNQTIKIDVSIKNNLQLTPISWKIQSIFQDHILEEHLFDKHSINCIDIRESTAEKLRAWLTRNIPAIRDFFDIWYIKNNSEFDFTSKEFLDLVYIKLDEANFEYTLENKKEKLFKQIQTDLVPVLNLDANFDFDEIFNFVLSFRK
mgnify:CR=1 FL=1